MEESIKVVFLGKASVGKSSLLQRLVEDSFDPSKAPTIGAAFVSVVVDDISFDIWDTAGQERYRSMAPLYFRNSHAAIIVFDSTDPESFSEAKEWIMDVESHTQDILIVLCANKIDQFRSSGRDDCTASTTAEGMSDPTSQANSEENKTRRTSSAPTTILTEGDAQSLRNESGALSTMDTASSMLTIGSRPRGHSGRGQITNLLDSAMKFAMDHGYEFVETSALSGENVRRMFELIAERAREAMREQRADSFISRRTTADRVLLDDSRKKKKGCKCNLL